MCLLVSVDGISRDIYVDYRHKKERSGQRPTTRDQSSVQIFEGGERREGGREGSAPFFGVIVLVFLSWVGRSESLYLEIVTFGPSDLLICVETLSTEESPQTQGT